MAETYGPWQEGRIHEEIIYAGAVAEEAGDVIYELLGEAPTTRSGWVWGADIGSNGSYASSVSQSEHWPGGISNPPPENPLLSQAAYEAALNTPVYFGYSMQHKVTAYGNRNYIGAGAGWGRSHGWRFEGVGYEMNYGAALGDYPGVLEALAVPAGVDPYTETYGTQLEPYVTGGLVRPTLLEAEVLSMTPPVSDGNANLFVKDAGITTGFLHLGPVSIEDSKIRGPGPLNVEVLKTLQAEIDAGVYTYEDPRMPQAAVLWTGSFPGTTLFGDTIVTQGDGGRSAVRIKWQMPRWRRVFYDIQEGRYKVNINQESEGPYWKYLIPRAGENGGVGVGKINLGTGTEPIWQRLDRRLKVSDGNTFLEEPPS